MDSELELEIELLVYQAISLVAELEISELKPTTTYLDLQIDMLKFIEILEASFRIRFTQAEIANIVIIDDTMRVIKSHVGT